MFLLRKDLSLKIAFNTSLKISDDLVSITIIFYHVSTVFVFIVDNPNMQPRRDYDDYSRFINDTYLPKKHDLLNNTVQYETKNSGDKPGKNLDRKLLTLRTHSQLAVNGSR